MSGSVALVTGASRGIGKASALALADAGFDVVATARTVREGERFEHSSTLRASDTRPVPGSLETTAAAIRERGREVLPLRMDLMERDSIGAVVSTTLERWKRIDVLVNNAVYTAPGSMDRFQDLPLEVIERIFEANVFAQIHLTQHVLPGMLERGSGTVINITSHVAGADPPGPVGDGGWGFGYAASKGAFHRMAGILHVELGDRGIAAFNVDPGFVVTEMMQIADHGAALDRHYRGAPPSVPAAVVAWLASSPEARELRGRTVHAQKLCLERGLHPDWR